MAKAAATIVPALKLLLSPGDHQPQGVCAVVGDDAFIKHEVRLALSRTLLGDGLLGEGTDDLGATVLEGKTAELRDVRDALSERSLFGGETRVVVIEDADSFVKQYREQLEALVEKLAGGAVLILEVTSWPGNTRLAKAVAASGLTISCQVPEKGAELTAFTKLLKDWLILVAKRDHQVELKRPAVDLLVDLLPPEPGILFQEIARLALLTENKAAIDADLVREHVGGWRTRKTWDMIDAAADGNAAEALAQLDRLIAAGEEPHALLPQMASTLRRFAAAARTYEQAEAQRRPLSLRAALEESGMMAFKLGTAENQLKQIGRPRAKQLYRWLLAADLELKGHNSTKDRARRVLEILIVRLAKQATPTRPAPR
ncbi:MAG: DNA polymerase III subunit delta [Bythopirellula sp.]|nr:DNA polymerase III subunit delta [Bythopirellula sp.]